MEIQEWINKNSNIKGYAHFDTRISLKEVFNEVTDSNFIIKHAFMPFIHYSLTFHKFSKLNGRKDKIRQLYYSAHYDRCIYQYYSYLLNERYNEKASLLNINNVAIAYRTNLQKNNIHFAKEAFDFIKQQEHCFIIVGDFKDFFDTLEHNYLKQKLCELLEVEVLPNDYYKVFKSITNVRYSWGISGILNQNSVNSEFVKGRPKTSRSSFFAFFMWDDFPLQGNITIFANNTQKTILPFTQSFYLSHQSIFLLIL